MKKILPFLIVILCSAPAVATEFYCSTLQGSANIKIVITKDGVKILPVKPEVKK